MVMHDIGGGNGVTMSSVALRGLVAGVVGWLP